MCHIPKQSPLNTQYTLTKIKDVKVKQVLSWGEYHVYENRTMKPVEIVQRMEKE
jgi:hypothetical protein